MKHRIIKPLTTILAVVWGWALMGPCLPAGFAAGADQMVIATPFGPSTAVPDPARGSNGWYTSEAGATETLFTLDFDMNLVPWLVRNYRRISPLVWEIELKDGVVFHDRTSLDARAVAWSLSRLIDEKSDAFNKRIQKMLDIRSMEVKDKLRLQMTTHAPNAAFLSTLTASDTAILSPAGKGRKVLGTGPFQLDEVLPKEQMTLSRFDGYWGEKAKVPKILLKVVQNPATRMLAFEAGQLDISTYFPENDAVRIASRKDVRIVHRPTNRLCFFFVRVQDGPLADVRIRKAINCAIDRQQIVQTILAGIGGEACGGIFPKILPWCNTALTPWPYDPDQARALLARAGAKDTDGDGVVEIDGRPLVLHMWTYDTRAALKPTLELVQAQLAKVGIGARLKVTRKASSINQAMQRGDVHLNLQMWNTAPQGDPHFFTSNIFSADAGSNFMGYQNAELDELVRQGKVTFDPEERKRIYNRIQQIIYDECPVIVLFHKSMVTAIYDHVKNYRIHPAEKYLVTPQLEGR